jgi:hypothetical protein
VLVAIRATSTAMDRILLAVIGICCCRLQKMIAGDARSSTERHDIDSPWRRAPGARQRADAKTGQPEPPRVKQADYRADISACSGSTEGGHPPNHPPGEEQQSEYPNTERESPSGSVAVFFSFSEIDNLVVWTGNMVVAGLDLFSMKFQRQLGADDSNPRQLLPGDRDQSQ